MTRIRPFRNCEHCRRNDGCITVLGEHWLFCHRHRSRWRIDACTFDAWSDRLDTDLLTTWERVRRYRDVARDD
jgi:hypothetical protein